MEIARQFGHQLHAHYRALLEHAAQNFVRTVEVPRRKFFRWLPAAEGV
jgi:hypothetical protein